MREPITVARPCRNCTGFLASIGDLRGRARERQGRAGREHIDKGGAGRLKCRVSTVSRMRGTGNAVRAERPKSAAAPATVSGEPEPNSHWEIPREGGEG